MTGRAWVATTSLLAVPRPSGLVAGTLAAAVMTTPSLIPRDGMTQGVVSGVCAAVAYGIAALVARAAGRPAPGRRGTVAVACAVLLVVTLVVSAGWQRRTGALTGVPGPAVWFAAGPVLVAVAVGLVLLGRAVASTLRACARALRERPARVAPALVLVVAGAVALPAAALPATSGLGAGDPASAGVTMPVSATRSGSAASLVRWETLDREGRRFVAGGPTPRRIARVRTPVAEPVRVYAAMRSAPTARARAELAVAELDRTGAFRRPVIMVVTSTGTGWVNGAGVDAVETMYGGDTATVATQYSTLPSWMSFVVDRSRAVEEGRTLWAAVRARVDRMPPATRPRLLAGGESLGTLGSESAWSGPSELRAQLDGAVWVGPTRANPLWPALVDGRDAGTPAAAPVRDGGREVRFAAARSALGAPGPELRVVYLQHPSDPVVRWTPDLIVHRPDWLSEPHGLDVNPAMTWLPLVTFLQVTVDLIGSKSVPHGHGHNYDDLLPAAWAVVAPPPGWTQADTDRLLRG